MSGSVQTLGGPGTSDLTSQVAYPSADTGISTSWIDVAGLSLTLSKGTWLILVQLVYVPGNLCTCSAKIYNASDSVDVFASQKAIGGGTSETVTISYVLTLTAQKVIKIQAKTDFNGATVYKLGSGIPASIFIATKLAS